MSIDIRSLHLIARPDGLPQDSDFELRSTPAPELSEGEILIAVRYVSIDPAMRVWMSEQKSYWPPVGLGEVMRAGGIGEVLASNNSRYPVGAWVSGMTGVCDHLVCDGRGMRPFDARQLPHPAWALSVFGAPGMTAYWGLKDIGAAQEGEVLVVSAAAGAVGSTVVQLGKAWGMKVIGIAGGPDKCAYLRDELGADAAIDYKNESVASALRQHCPDGVDVYFDNVGGEILDAVLKRLRMHARIVLCGGISQYNAQGEVRGPSNYLSLISSRARMQGFVVIDYFERGAEFIGAVAPLVAGGKLGSRIDVVENLENFPEALRRVYTGANFGKQVLKI